MATNANWPSDSWPAQPVSTVADTATIRKTSTVGVVDESARQGLELRQQEPEREQDRDPAVAQQPRQRVFEQLLHVPARVRGVRRPRRLVAALRPRAEQHEQHEQDEDHQRVGARVARACWRGR